MSDWYQEISESDTRTAYQLTRRVWDGKTEFCDKVLIADSPVYGRMLFLDGELQSASADEHLYHESLVHPAMAAHGSPSRVLVVGGGEGATVREVLRWPTVTHVDWVDIDGELVDLCREHLKWAPAVYDDSRVNLWRMDIGEVVPMLLGNYDVIIVDLPDPDGECQYLYTSLFWEDMQLQMSPSGHLVTHVGPVRPFGNVGAGWQRVREAFGEEGARGCFYSTCIPSFQGEWGFWTWSAQGQSHSFEFAPWLPPDLRLVDHAQLQRWAEGSLVWRNALVASSSALGVAEKVAVEAAVLEEQVENGELGAHE